MIITANDIRTVRAIAQNINETDRIDTYIEEVENLFLIPQFGARLFKEINENKPEYGLLLNGGFYDGDKKHIPGLIKAVAYLVYSRFVINQPINITAFGAVFKNGEFSEKVDEQNLIRAAKQAEKIGLEYLSQCVEFLIFDNKISCGTGLITKRKFKIIGD